MSLPAREQQVLDGIEAILQADEARLTSMFFFFGCLAGDKEKPTAEELGPPSRRSPAGGRRTGGRRTGGSREWLRVVILLTMLVAALGAALVVEVSASSIRTCAHRYSRRITLGPRSASPDPARRRGQCRLREGHGSASPPARVFLISLPGAR